MPQNFAFKTYYQEWRCPPNDKREICDRVRFSVQGQTRITTNEASLNIPWQEAECKEQNYCYKSRKPWKYFCNHRNSHKVYPRKTWIRTELMERVSFSANSIRVSQVYRASYESRLSPKRIFDRRFIISRGWDKIEPRHNWTQLIRTKWIMFVWGLRGFCCFILITLSHISLPRNLSLYLSSVIMEMTTRVTINFYGRRTPTQESHSVAFKRL